MSRPDELDDLVNPADIAERFGVVRTTVSMWAMRYRRPTKDRPAFPRPVRRFGSHPLFRWVEVERWGMDTNRLPVGKGRAKS